VVLLSTLGKYNGIVTHSRPRPLVFTCLQFIIYYRPTVSLKASLNMPLIKSVSFFQGSDSLQICCVDKLSKLR